MGRTAGISAEKIKLLKTEPFASCTLTEGYLALAYPTQDSLPSTLSFLQNARRTVLHNAGTCCQVNSQL